MALPTSPRALLTTRALTPKAKLRLLAEPLIPRTAEGAEESIAAFVRRRLGSEILDYAIDPFVAGIYAGDPERISVAAAFPRLLALEQGYGSLVAGSILGARARKRSGSTAKISARSFSFRGGMQTLTDRLAERLSPSIACDTSVSRIARDAAGGWLVESARDGQQRVRYARCVVLAVPAARAAALIQGLVPDAAVALSGIEYAPIIVVATAYRRRDIEHSLAGFGFLVPKKERLDILGCLFSSSMFDERAPDSDVLLTTFCGGRRNPEAVAMDDERVSAIVRANLAMLLGATAPPLWQEVVRWPRAIPQYDLGHLDRIRRLADAEQAVPGLYFCASYRGGVAVGDCIASADSLARRVDAYLAGIDSGNPVPSQDIAPAPGQTPNG